MRPVLNSLVAGMMSNSAAQARIIGHTDSTGTDAINNPLSVNRAASTRNYLVNQDIAANRIHIDGRGSYEPIASNTLWLAVHKTGVWKSTCLKYPKHKHRNHSIHSNSR